ncbi:phosphatase PAP2 family protein [Vineibacter terrae]|uniref:Phosphatase PAP2 family protein n=2 Tax=Vineibacter terrae TaxID=2586908 RepID=A0A5C8PSV6_9HYPH|nr:phosphatase PAP2 family protein [Vineibacter terrae]
MQSALLRFYDGSMTIADVGSTITALDRSITLALNQLVGQSPIFDLLVFYTADMNLLKGVPFMAAAWFLWFHRGGAARPHVVNLMIIALLAIATARILQLGMPSRLRPLDDPTLALALAAHVTHDVLHDWSSFPSDHATMFFAMAAALVPVSGRLASLAFAWVAIVICLPRLYLGFHYTSDVIAGAIIGIVVAFIYLRLPVQNLTRWILKLSVRLPGLFYAGAFVFTFEISFLMGDVRQLGMQAVKLLHRLTS